jgi:hypothetical protein
VAPGAIEVAAFGENHNADSRPVVNGVALNIEDKRLLHLLIFSNMNNQNI